MFGFLVLVYKCKALPTLEQHCNVYFIGFISSFFSSRCCSVFLYTVSFLLLTVMTCICLIPPPPSPFFQCVLISNVCGFADGFMKKTSGQKKETKIAWCLEMGGGRSGWSLPSFPFDMNTYVKTLMFSVEDGSISRSKNKIKRMLTLSTYHEKGLFFSFL